ncbi:protein FAR1-RELATED SEQUENCE 5-like [Tasmannia lanceolata]|uniref:protein FAR1-RELATED SEQUENCE 5-like n=1 Tax=Tasmannia lanceolata TaxID=3420 RepID=UPI004063B275
MDDSLSPTCGFPIEEVGAPSSWFVDDVMCQSCGVTINDVDENDLILGDEREDLNDENNEEVVENKSFVGRVFERSEDAYDCYNAYGLVKGFGIRKSSFSKSTKTQDVISRKFVCNKQGVKNSKDKRLIGREVKERRTWRVECEAKMVIKKIVDDKWIVSAFEDKHSHELTSPLRRKMHRCHNQVHKTETCKNLVDSFNDIGMRAVGIVRTVNILSDGAHGILKATQVHSRLKIKRKNNMGQDAVIVANHLQRKRAEDPEFFFSLELDTDMSLRSMFWADARARESYRSFSDITVFNVTYKTNWYSMSFAPFTRVNHHKQCTLFGCALLADAREETFTWLFEQWLLCMHGKAPGAIITDMDLAMKNAITNVFPNTRHRFCSWHIGKHLVENVAAMRDPESDFPRYYDRWFYSSDISECEVEWEMLKEKHNIREGDWLAKMWELRTHWVPTYWRGTFTAGMKSSQRSESMNAFFDGFVNQKTSLQEFIDQYEKAFVIVAIKKQKRISSQKIQWLQ